MRFLFAAAWWVWVYWISPLSYAQVALNVNEMTAPRWDIPYSLNPSERLGDEILRERGDPVHYFRIWVSVAVLCGMNVILNGLIILACKYLGCESPTLPTLSPCSPLVTIF